MLIAAIKTNQATTRTATMIRKCYFVSLFCSQVTFLPFRPVKMSFSLPEQNRYNKQAAPSLHMKYRIEEDIYEYC